MTKLNSPWSPNANPAAWDTIEIAGITFHGKVDVDGDLWKKKNTHHKARGHSGARTVATGWDLGEFGITLSSYDDTTDDELARIVDAVTVRSPNADNSAITVSHPALLAASINQATFEGASAPKPSDAGGLLVWESKWKEYRAPVKKTATRTVAPAPQAPAPLSAAELSRALTLGYRPVPLPPPSSDP